MVDIFVHYVYTKNGRKTNITCDDTECKYNRYGICYHRPLQFEITRYRVKCLSKKLKYSKKKETGGGIIREKISKGAISRNDSFSA